MLTLDMDYGTPDIWEQIKMLFDFKCCIYSTHKHTPENPRLRLIIPFSRDISEEEYPPGTKFDSILVLNGKQRVGKSTLFAKLGRQWFSDSLSIADMKDKTAPEKLQGYWILE